MTPISFCSIIRPLSETTIGSVHQAYCSALKTCLAIATKGTTAEESKEETRSTTRNKPSSCVVGAGVVATDDKRNQFVVDRLRRMVSVFSQSLCVLVSVMDDKKELREAVNLPDLLQVLQ